MFTFTGLFVLLKNWVLKFLNYVKALVLLPSGFPRPPKVNVIPVAEENPPPVGPHLMKKGKSVTKTYLKLRSWDLMLEKNGKAHNTSPFSLMKQKGAKQRLVIRRGQEFFIKLNLDREYDTQHDGIALVFTLDEIRKPQHGHGTLVIVPVLNVGEEIEANWRAQLYTKEVNSIVVKIITPANALVGKWKVDIDVSQKDVAGATSFTTNQPIYILFNPWCPEDTVYIAEEEKRQEYVVQDIGCIYRGTHRQVLPTMWKYGQFKKDMLDCALYLMNTVGQVGYGARNNPIIVSRVLSGIINSDGKDKSNVIVSNYSNDFTGGTPPTYWMGSYGILSKYYETKQSVKYAQCWVLAGLYTTVCRALGLPCRVVTNYSSARDADGNLTIEYIIDAEGRLMDDIDSDSIWTFHTWNEVWMQRLDLGDEYSGWQAIDTSLLKTDSSKRCGPASIAAIKKGEVRKAFNGDVLFSEVNADEMIWKYNGTDIPLTLIRKDATSVGKQVVTKPIGIKKQEESLLDNYKFPEESQEERKAMNQALNRNEWFFNRFRSHQEEEEFKNIKFDFKFRNDVMIGDSFDVTLIMENLHAQEEYKVSVIVRFDSILYTGKMSQPIKYIATECVVKPGTKEEVNLPLTWFEYGLRLQNQCIFNVACLAKVHDVNYEYFTHDFFQLLKPKIDTVTTKNYEANKVDKISSFVNPLPIALHNGEFAIDAPFLDEELRIKVPKTIMPGEKVSCNYWVQECGDANMLKTSIKFHSKELDDVEGYHFSSIKAE